eukprot:1865742-Pleurochrysis_carterae.AAC.2
MTSKSVVVITLRQYTASSLRTTPQVPPLQSGCEEGLSDVDQAGLATSRELSGISLITDSDHADGRPNSERL